MEVKGFLGHFEGSVPHSDFSSPPTAEEAASVAQWDKDEYSVKALLTHHIPDSTLVHVYNKSLLKDCWDLIVMEYIKKGLFAQVELRTKFMESHCPDKGSVHEFLDALWMKKEEYLHLESLSRRKTTILQLSSLLLHLSNFALNLLARAQLYALSKTIKSDLLIALISEDVRGLIETPLFIHIYTRGCRIYSPKSYILPTVHKNTTSLYSLM